jgi:hypothetical protein
LLVPLFNLLPLRFACITSVQLLVLLFLLLLQSLVLLLLSTEQFALLALVFLVQQRISGVWGSGTRMRRKVSCVNYSACIRRTGHIVLHPIRPARLFSSDRSAVIKCSGFGRCGDRRTAMVHRSP